MSRHGGSILILALALAAGAAHAQTEGGRASIPPGESRDGAAPAEGAIKGGAIEPVIPSVTAERQAARCRELAGVLREQCLRDLGAAAAGESAFPQPAAPAPVQRDPAIDPPPQNPRLP